MCPKHDGALPWRPILPFTWARFWMKPKRGHHDRLHSHLVGTDVVGLLACSSRCHVMREAAQHRETKTPGSNAGVFVSLCLLMVSMLSKESRPDGATVLVRWPRQQWERVAASVHPGRSPEALPDDCVQSLHCR